MIAVAARIKATPFLMPDSGVRENSSLRKAGKLRRRSSPMMRVLAAALLFALPAVIYVNQSTKASRVGYRILTLRAEVRSLEAEHARLLAATTSLKSPDRIEQVATHQLDMVKPESQQMTALILPATTLAVQPPAQLSLRQRLSALLLKREAEAGESP